MHEVDALVRRQVAVRVAPRHEQPRPTPERMTAVLAQVHEVIRAADDDLDIDPALAACLQLSLAGPRCHRC